MSLFPPNRGRSSLPSILRESPANIRARIYIINSRSDEKEITSVYAAGEEDVDVAVNAARKALKADSWKLLPATERGNLMLKLADLVDQHRETLATIETWDNGTSSHFALKLEPYIHSSRQTLLRVPR